MGGDTRSLHEPRGARGAADRKPIPGSSRGAGCEKAGEQPLIRQNTVQ